jgi:CO/xanthine dehydrogenase FAD-binding subunit
MHRFDYYEPRTVEEACKLLFEFGSDASILAGGTDLIPKMKNGLMMPDHIVNIKKIPDLDFIKGDGETLLRIGALTLISELAIHPLLLERFPVITTAARSIGSLQVRNLATLGGNLCNGAPSADMAPGLLVMDSRVKVTGPSGDREMPLEDFFVGPGRVNLGKGELLTEIHVPFPPANTKQLYLKHSVRRAMDIAIVGVAVSLSFEEKTEVCRKARIALGAVAPTPVRAKRTEEMLLGKKLREILLIKVGEMVSQEVAPITDVRGSAGYRSEIVSKLTLKAIERLSNLPEVK